MRPWHAARMIETATLDRYLEYLRAVPEAFDAPADASFQRRLNALVDARRQAREKAGLSEAEVETAAEAIEWAKKHAQEVEAAETKAEARFQT